VTFTYAIDFSLLKVAYLTLIDRYTLTAFTFVLAAIFAVSVIHVMLKSKDDERAPRLQTGARRYFPPAFLGMIVVVVLVSFR